MARPKQDQNKPLTDTELQIMNILWEMESGTVHDVLEELTKVQEKDYAYTTVSTILRVLEKKEAVASEKEGRGHRYKAIIEKEKYQKKATEHLVSHVFAGKQTALIRSLLGSAELSEEELKEVKEFLDSRV